MSAPSRDTNPQRPAGSPRGTPCRPSPRAGCTLPCPAGALPVPGAFPGAAPGAGVPGWAAQVLPCRPVPSRPIPSPAACQPPSALRGLPVGEVGRNSNGKKKTKTKTFPAPIPLTGSLPPLPPLRRRRAAAVTRLPLSRGPPARRSPPAATPLSGAAEGKILPWRPGTRRGGGEGGGGGLRATGG